MVTRSRSRVIRFLPQNSRDLYTLSTVPIPSLSEMLSRSLLIYTDRIMVIVYQKYGDRYRDRRALLVSIESVANSFDPFELYGIKTMYSY